MATRSEVTRVRGANADAIVFHALPPFVHGFSHYLLDVTPLALDIDPAPGIADGAGRRWLHPRDASALGLPAPVRKLIESLS